MTTARCGETRVAAGLGKATAVRYGREKDSTVAAAVAHPQAGKFLAVILYCCHGASLEQTVADFARHPEWRSA
jgi:hypothetical protein